MKTVAIYCRTSLTTQSLDRQIYECKQYVTLRSLGCITLYTDQSSGRKIDKRPEFQSLMKNVKLGKHSHVIVLSTDRFSRSTKDLLNSIEILEECKTKFVSINNDIDTSSSSGKLILTMLAGVAQFEADLIKERVLSGMQAAKRAGVHCGRPRMDKDREYVEKLLVEGSLSQREIASVSGMSKGFVSGAAKGLKAIQEAV